MSISILVYTYIDHSSVRMRTRAQGRAYFFRKIVGAWLKNSAVFSCHYSEIRYALSPWLQVIEHRFSSPMSLGWKQFTQPTRICTTLFLFILRTWTICSRQYCSVRVGGTEISYTAAAFQKEISLQVGYQRVFRYSPKPQVQPVFCMRIPRQPQFLGLGCTYRPALSWILQQIVASCFQMAARFVFIGMVTWQTVLAQAGRVFRLPDLIVYLCYYWPVCRFSGLLQITILLQSGFCLERKAITFFISCSWPPYTKMPMLDLAYFVYKTVLPRSSTDVLPYKLSLTISSRSMANLCWMLQTQQILCFLGLYTTCFLAYYVYGCDYCALPQLLAQTQLALSYCQWDVTQVCLKSVQTIYFFSFFLCLRRTFSRLNSTKLLDMAYASLVMALRGWLPRLARIKLISVLIELKSTFVNQYSNLFRPMEDSNSFFLPSGEPQVMRMNWPVFLSTRMDSLSIFSQMSIFFPETRASRVPLSIITSKL